MALGRRFSAWSACAIDIWANTRPALVLLQKNHGEPLLIKPVMPALTCSAQATYLTGTLPSEHGIVGNGWYDRTLNEHHFWKQSNRLVGGPKIWEKLKADRPGFGRPTCFGGSTCTLPSITRSRLALFIVPTDSKLSAFMPIPLRSFGGREARPRSLPFSFLLGPESRDRFIQMDRRISQMDGRSPRT